MSRCRRWGPPGRCWAPRRRPQSPGSASSSVARHALVVEPEQLDHVVDVAVSRDPAGRRTASVREHRVIGYPPVPCQLLPDVLGKEEVGGMIAVEVPDLVPSDLEGKLAAPACA